MSLAVGALSIAGCAAEGPSMVAQAESATSGERARLMSIASARSEGSVATDSLAATPHLTYFGGKVMENAHVFKVLYGSGNYIPEITSTTGINMNTAYEQMLSSGVHDWLEEYNTTSPPQTIGRGSFRGSTQITPATGRNGTRISDANIQAELAAQIAGGTLPPPDDNALYVIHFPRGKTITFETATSCIDFCAYHGTFQINGQNVYYGVMPDLRDGSCANGCGAAPTTFQNQTSVASHEVIEAITDPEIGLVTDFDPPGPPLAWFDPTFSEIADICNHQQGTFIGTDGATYTIQKEWSNQANACITTRGTPEPSFRAGLVDTFFLAPGLRVSSLVPTQFGSNLELTFADVNLAWGLNDMGNWKVAGDINRDGRPDLVDTVFLNPGLRIYTALSTATGAWQLVGDSVNLAWGLNDMGNWKVAGDINGDGRPDLVDTVFLNPGLRIYTALSTGDGTWQLVGDNVNLAYSRNDMGNWKVAGDINGDGLPDLVNTLFLFPGLRVYTALSTGAGTWQLVFNDPNLSYGVDDMANWKIAGDLNDDGRPDLVNTFFRNPGLRVYTLLSTGVATWHLVFDDVNSAYSVDDMANWKVAGDINGDGRPDLVDTFFLNPGLRVQTMISTGPGTWALSFQTVSSTYAVNDMANWKVMHLDGDGIPDLVDTFFQNPGLAVNKLLSTGFGTWAFSSQTVNSAYGVNDMTNWKVAGLR
jgi:hypothetical protein